MKVAGGAHLKELIHARIWHIGPLMSLVLNSVRNVAEILIRSRVDEDDSISQSK